MDMLTEKVQTLIEDAEYGEIKDRHRKKVTEQLLKNQINFLKENSTASVTQTAGVQNWDPVLVKMVRRSAPLSMAFDLAGVQPMTGPTGSIFAMRARYANQTGAEAQFNEANSAWSGTGSQVGDTSGFPADFFGSDDPAQSTTSGTGMSKTAGENLGTVGNPKWNEMTFNIERTDVTAKTRKLRASYTRELAHDLKQIHGLDAEAELSNILSTEIIAEQDREFLRTMNVSATIGAQFATVAGRFDLSADADGRWLVEKFKGFLFALELDANIVGRLTRRGKANRVVCSANVASMLNMAGVLEYNPNLAPNIALNTDENMSTYGGVLLGRYQVYIDPYATVDYVTLGYKGSNAWDAGIYWAPYVPLEMIKVEAMDDSMQPAIGFTSRYGIKANPFCSRRADGTQVAGEGLGQGENFYFRKFQVINLQG